jgi:hypothetical protein
LVLRTKRLAQKRLGPIHEIKKVRIEVPEKGKRKRVQDAWMDIAWSRAKKNPGRPIEGGIKFSHLGLRTRMRATVSSAAKERMPVF